MTDRKWTLEELRAHLDRKPPEALQCPPLYGCLCGCNSRICSGCQLAEHACECPSQRVTWRVWFDGMGNYLGNRSGAVHKEDGDE